MAQKAQEKGVTGPAPVVDEPGKVRNVVLVGHSGAGKTTLVEALLAVTGTIGRAGSVTEGTTVSDHDPAAVRQQRSVSLACAPIMHDGSQGQPARHPRIRRLRRGAARRPAGRRRRAVRRLGRGRHGRRDRRPVGGVRRRRHAPGRRDLPPGPPSAPTSTRRSPQCQRVFGDGVLPLYLPMLGDDGESTVGLMGLITQRVFDYSKGLPARGARARRRAPAGHRRRPQRADRGDHRRERGRDAHGALPRRRGDRDRASSSRTWRRPSPAAPSTRWSRSAPRPGSAWTRCWSC